MCVCRESQAHLICLETGERQKAGFLRPVKLNGGRGSQATGQVRQQKTNKIKSKIFSMIIVLRKKNKGIRRESMLVCVWEEGLEEGRCLLPFRLGGKGRP